jgi:hypothetical protein
MDIRVGVTGVVVWYVRSVKSRMDNGVLVFLPPRSADTTVILIFRGKQAAASSMMFRNGLGACGGVGAAAHARAIDVKIDRARMSPNIVTDRWYVC